MEDVLVITLPQRNYTYGSNSTYNETVGGNVNTQTIEQLSLNCLTRFFWLSVECADKRLRGWVSWRGSAVRQSAQREDAQAAEQGILWCASEWHPLRKRLLLRCVWSGSIAVQNRLNKHYPNPYVIRCYRWGRGEGVVMDQAARTKDILYFSTVMLQFMFVCWQSHRSQPQHLQMVCSDVHWALLVCVGENWLLLIILKA